MIRSVVLEGKLSYIANVVRINPAASAAGFLYIENHSLYEWFKKAYGDEQNTE